MNNFCKSRLKFDIILILTVIFVAIILIVWQNAAKGDGKTVVITVGGETYLELSLSKNVELSVDGLLTVVISNGEVYVKDSTCPDALCERAGKISRSGERIVCLPNGVVIRIVEVEVESEPEYDFVN